MMVTWFDSRLFHFSYPGIFVTGLLPLEPRSMLSSIRLCLKGPSPSGQPQFVRFHIKCDAGDFQEDLAAAVGLSQASQLSTVSFTSLGEVHGHAAMPRKMRQL